MNKIVFLIFMCINLLMVMSCKEPITDNEYTYVWQPTDTTTWYGVSDSIMKKVSSNFKVTSTGFEYIVTLDSTGRDTSFTPIMYVVSNITTANRREVSFDVTLKNATDTLLMIDSTKTVFSYASYNGSIISIGNTGERETQTYTLGAESITSAMPESKKFSFSTNPDRSGKQILFGIKLSWVNYGGQTPLQPFPFPKSKKVTVVVSNLKITTFDIDVLKK